MSKEQNQKTKCKNKEEFIKIFRDNKLKKEYELEYLIKDSSEYFNEELYYYSIR